MELTRKFLNELQKRLKIGNRRGVHLNAIPAKSAYKFDLSRLSHIEQHLPDQFIKSLLTEQPLRFRITWKNNVPDLNILKADDQVQLVKITKSFENLINQTEAIESEKGINTFGFGFPLLIRRDQADNQLTVAPILIWSLKAKRTKEFNTWEIIRSEEDPIYLNEVLINHLQNDSQVEIKKISDEMLDDGLIDSVELIDICADLIESINSSFSPETKQSFSESIKNVVPIKEKKYYESLPLTPYNAFVEFGGLFSIFEVQKQNIIHDYEHLLGLEGCSIDQNEMNENVFQPLSSVETDPSQQSILNGLGTERNIVIQGPPGTGKSQSLTAVLVNALENHKKTIVVCEKRTALEVLQNALNGKGLHYNCVLIKDIVKDRKVAVDSVRDRIEAKGYRRYHHTITKESLDYTTGQSAKLIQSINNKHLKLDQRILGNKKWTELVGEFLKEKRKLTETYGLNLDKGDFEFTTKELQDFLLLIDKGHKYWDVYAPFQSYRFINPEKLIGPSPFRIEQELNEDYDLYKKFEISYIHLVEKYRDFFYQTRKTELERQFLQVKELKALHLQLEMISGLVGDFKIRFSQIKSKEILEQATRLTAHLDVVLKFIEDHQSDPFFSDEQKTASFGYKLNAFFSSKKKAVIVSQRQLRILIDQLYSLSQGCPDFNQFKISGQLYEDMSRCEELKQKFILLQDKLQLIIDEQFSNINLLHTIPSQYQNEFSEGISALAIDLQEKLGKQSDYEKLINEGKTHIVKCLNESRDLGVLVDKENVDSALSSINEPLLTELHREKIKAEFCKLNLLDVENLPYENILISQLVDLVTEIRTRIVNDNWTTKPLHQTNSQIFTEDLIAVIKEKELYFNAPHDIFTAEFNWFNFYHALPEKYHGLVNELKVKKDWNRTFLIYYLNSLLLNSADNDLPQDDRDFLELQHKLESIGDNQIRYINEYWYSKQVEMAQRFESQNPNISVENLYNKRSGTKFKRLSLRQVAQSDIDLFTTYFPVILTTPDVCSNLFRGLNGYFDLVIFDEASQLRIEDNLPAILKGKQVLIAGDEHQMPPSSYFSKILDGGVEDEDDIEEEETPKVDKEDLLLSCESLLDFATEMNFEKRYLDFHYRSRHPYLIDFSNHAFYNQRLCPLPNDFDYNPIKYIAVGGTFSDHTNEKEAECVLNIIENNIHRMPNGVYPSVGIATFNIAQRNLIKNKINDRRKFDHYKDFNAKIQELEEDGMFIKNLENIQGDERDIIIISTTYGISKDHKFTQRFGPLTQSKGYKLLNVIVTRAKYKIYVCCSIPESIFLNYNDHLIVEGSNNKKGVFYAYLAYAKAVSENNNELKQGVLTALAENTNAVKKLDIFNGQLESPFEEEVYTALVNEFGAEKLIPQLEFAGFRIDIVYDSGIPGKSKIAIECDGANYHSSHEAYLYDIYRQKILEQHGFKFHRIWSTNWWRNTTRETTNLVSFIKDTINNPDKLQDTISNISDCFTDNYEAVQIQPIEIEPEYYSLAEVISDNINSAGQGSLFGDSIRKGSLVNVKYIDTDKMINVQLVSAKEPTNNTSNGYQKISVDSPLGKSLSGKIAGDMVKIGDLDNFVEVIKVTN